MSWPGAALVAVLTLVGSAASSTTVFSFHDDRINESSGLVDLGTTMVTTNDSGDAAVVYVVGARSGRTVATTAYAEEVEDVEALAPAGDAAVWVADIGDNLVRRTSVQVYRVPVGSGDQTVRAESFDLVYPDGPHDAESLVYGPDSRLRIITKSLLGGRVYVAPRELDPDRPNRLVAGPPVDIWATDAALFPDGKHVLVRGYGAALVATFPGFKTLAEIPLPDQDQGEGVSIGSSGRIRLSSEGVGSEVLQIRLPDQVREQLRGTPAAGAGAGVNPEGVVDSDHASGLDWRWVAAGAAGAVLGWALVRRRRRRR